MSPSAKTAAGCRNSSSGALASAQLRAADVDRAVEVARKRGAREEEEPGMGYDGVVRPGHAHHAPFMRTPNDVVLEVHSAIPGGSVQGAETAGILARSRQVEWEGAALRVPSAADAVAGACLHVFDHHLGAARYLRRQLADLAVTIGPGATTWDEVRTLVPGWGGRVAGRLRFLFPDRRYMAAKYRVSPRSPALPALYLWRLVQRSWAAVTGR